MRFYYLVAIAVAGIMLGLGASFNTAEAHAPSSVILTNITNSTVQINWVHEGDSTTSKKDVDVVMIAQGGSNYTKNIVNNSTLRSVVAASLAEGTEYQWWVCHGKVNEELCLQEAGKFTTKIYGTTAASAVTDIQITEGDGSALLQWNMVSNTTHNIVNNTSLDGWKIEYSSDGGTTYTTATSNSSATTNIGNMSYEVTGLQTSLEYLFRISGVTQSNSFNVDMYAGYDNCGFCGVNATFIGNTGGSQDRSASFSSAPMITDYATGSISDDNLQVSITEDKGWDRILNAALYTNIRSDQTKQDSDTYIIWNFFDPVFISDPHGYFSSVDVIATQTGVRTMDITYDISWNKSLPKSDVLLEVADFQSNTYTTSIPAAWKTFPVKQVAHVTPEETSEETIAATAEKTSEETIAMLWDGGVMNHIFLSNNVDYALVSNMQYFVEDDVIDVTQDDNIVVQEQESAIEIFEKVTISQDNVKVGVNYLKTLVISGTLNDKIFSAGSNITFTVTSPDGTVSEISAVTTSDRTFKLPIITDKFESGTYQFQPIYNDHMGEPILYKH